jgi:dihydrofolate synthase
MTRKEVQLSEARSYYNVATVLERFNFLEAPAPAVKNNSRILVEEFALDSYYNILFSLIEFWRHTGSWPSRFTIVSHAFKKQRIVDGHCASIGFPLHKVKYVGIDPPDLPKAIQPPLAKQTKGYLSGPRATWAEAFAECAGDAEKSEVIKGIQAAEEQWTADPRGVGPVLAGKRMKRNPWDTKQELFRSDEERRRSGVDTEFINGTEALVEGGRRPWAA